MDESSIFNLITTSSRRDDLLVNSSKLLTEVRRIKGLKRSEEIKNLGVIPSHRTNIRWTKKNRKKFTKDGAIVSNANGTISLISDYRFDINDSPDIVIFCLTYTFIYITDVDGTMKKINNIDEFLQISK